MTVVEIRSRRPDDGAVEIIGRVSVPAPGAAAVAVGIHAEGQAYLERLLAGGITGPDGRSLHLADGERFVAALPQAMRGSRLWAVRVPRDHLR